MLLPPLQELVLDWPILLRLATVRVNMG